jgi:hypothetical protein
VDRATWDAVQVELGRRHTRRQRARLERILDELLETPRQTEGYAGLTQRQQATEDAIRRLPAEAADQRQPPAVGIRDQAAAELQQFARDIADGIEDTSLAAQRWVFERVRLHGVIRLDPDGVPIGTKHRFDVDLEAVVALPDSVSKPKNKLVAYPLAADFLRRHLLGESPT